MKKVGNFIFIFFLLLMCVATAFETISQLKYADYSKICPVSIDSVQKLDEQNIKAIAPPDETLDIARYDYYLMVCTIENQSAIDGSFYPGSAFAVQTAMIFIMQWIPLLPSGNVAVPINGMFRREKTFR